jgi:hypothetical protein
MAVTCGVFNNRKVENIYSYEITLPCRIAVITKYIRYNDPL